MLVAVAALTLNRECLFLFTLRQLQPTAAVHKDVLLSCLVYHTNLTEINISSPDTFNLRLREPPFTAHIYNYKFRFR